MDEIVEERMAEILERHGNNLWTLNVIYYTTAITLIEKEGKLREVKKRSGNEVKQGWEIRIESRIEAIRRKLSYTYVLIECNKNQRHTKKNIRRGIEKQYGKTTTSKLKQIQNHLKQELKAESRKLRKRKKIRERRYINRVFKLALQKVYWSFKREGKKFIKDMPSKEKISNFWSQLWEISVQHNEDADWMNTLKEEYCRDAQQYHYEITDEVLERILKRPANDKPGRDQVAGIWLKRIKSLKHHYKEHLIHLLKSEAEPPEWLLTSKTLLLPKHEITSQAKNYPPIALQNTMYKVYTALLADFIMDHCEKNGIVTEEQAAGKRGSWGCSD